MAIEVINTIIAKVGVGLQGLLNILPLSPFDAVYNIDNKFIGFMNYILPIPQAVAHLSAYVSCVVIYYGIRIILKWVKAAGN